MKCRICGADIDDTAKFCNMCGERVVQSQDTNDESFGATANATNCEKKNSSKDMVDKIVKFIKSILEDGSAFVEKMLKSKSTRNEESKDAEENSHFANSEEKYSNKEMLEKIAKFITGVLSIVSGIMLIGAIVGIFDNNPVPFLVFIGVVMFVDWLQDKLPRFPTIFFAVFEILALIICFNISNNAVAVLSVKEGSPNLYPNITYERAFEDYFSNPEWEACGKDETGNEVVKFTGVCTYLGVDAIAEIEFKVYEEQGSFIVSSVTLNGEDMGEIGNLLVLAAFEEYEYGQ